MWDICSGVRFRAEWKGREHHRRPLVDQRASPRCHNYPLSPTDSVSTNVLSQWKAHVLLRNKMDRNWLLDSSYMIRLSPVSTRHFQCAVNYPWPITQVVQVIHIVLYCLSVFSVKHVLVYETFQFYLTLFSLRDICTSR